MLNRSTVLYLIFLIVSTSLSAQIEQKKRFELSFNLFESNNSIVPVNKELYVISRTGQYSLGNQTWEFIKLDSLLNMSWRQVISLDGSMDYTYSDTLNNVAYLLFERHSNRKEVQILKLYPNGLITVLPFKVLVPMYISKFEILGDGEQLLLGGYFNQRPLLVLYDLKTNIPKVLPGQFNYPGEFVQLTVSEEYKTISYVINNKGPRYNRGYWLKVYNFNGEIEKNVHLSSQSKLDFTGLRVVQSSDDTHLVAGFFGRRGSLYSRGIMLGLVYNKMENTRKVNFSELDNYFSFYKPGRTERINRRIERRRKKGKSTNYHYKMIMQNLENTHGEYVGVAESYYVRYQSQQSGVFYIPGLSGLYFNGYSFTHSMAFAFDESLNIRWENSLKVEDNRKYDLNQFTQAAIGLGEAMVFYSEGNTIYYKEFDKIDGKSVSGAEELELFDESKKLVPSSGGFKNIYRWYGDHFLVTGYQNVRPANMLAQPFGRKVFFINKVHFNPSISKN